MKYRATDYGKVKESIIIWIKSYIQFWCSKHVIATSSISDFQFLKQAVMSAID